MTEDKFILMGLDDERSKDLAEVLGNKTCKKIIDYLAEVKEASEKDISDALSIPINTVEYNLNKLIKSGLVEKTSNYFWSVKGKKIINYKLSNKKILISPRSLKIGIIPALIGVGALALGIKIIADKISYSTNDSVRIASDLAVANAPEMMEKSGAISRTVPIPPIQNICSSFNADAWAWFLLGGLSAILIFLLWNQYKKMKGGLL